MIDLPPPSFEQAIEAIVINYDPLPFVVDRVRARFVRARLPVEESMKSERRSSDDAMWHVPVPANGRATVTAVFDTRY